ncbi:DUF5723 family protein [Pedobacter nyackensis]|uniref:DUF5723 family protein n=1 Tax=Pedobacter nyackensis TaxID=475255 RepID=UPI00292E8701|nr:DUF5723 family protein [Pedobacter nyackensis]
MAKKYLILCALCICIAPFAKAQQYGLFNTRTLFDGFENPAQRTFVVDSSRKFASNFFLPNLGINAANKGNSDLIRRAINEGTYSAKDLVLGSGDINTIHQNTNIYLLTFRIFQSYKFQKELGFAWQLRSDAHLDYTNETLAILDSYRRFVGRTPYDDVFNNDGYEQSYHQFSVTYRENINKRLAFGAKISLLSGVTYNRLNITDSYLLMDPTNNLINVRVKGAYKASFLETDELSHKTAAPNFRNPGISLGFGTSYTAKNGVFMMANIKDLGFIKWGKTAYVNNISSEVNITDLSQKSSSQIESELANIATDESVNKSFYSLTNAKADFMISKPFSITYSFSYTPGLVVSKNLFYKGGDAAFVNKFKYNTMALSAIPTYNFNGLFLMGIQGMYQTPNFEIFLGSDNLFKTVTQINGALKQDHTIGTGYNGASFYMGVGIKFGNTVEHAQNTSTIPGINDQEASFFKRIFSVFSKKR